jgi:toxin CcdB
MAQFDVFRLPEGELVVDCQSDMVSGLGTRLVVPLQPIEDGGQVSARLNPLVAVNGDRLVLKTHFATALDARLLRERVGTLVEHEYAIKGALDFLISGI